MEREAESGSRTPSRATPSRVSTIRSRGFSPAKIRSAPSEGQADGVLEKGTGDGQDVDGDTENLGRRGEQTLREVAGAGAGEGRGGFPQPFADPVFEFSGGFGADEMTWYAHIGASLRDPRFTVRYIDRYTKRAVLAEYRITDYDPERGTVRFAFQDYAQGGKTSYKTLPVLASSVV